MALQMESRAQPHAKMGENGALGAYLITLLDAAQVFFSSCELGYEAAAAVDLPHKRPTVRRGGGHLLAPLAPIGAPGLARQRRLAPPPTVNGDGCQSTQS